MSQWEQGLSGILRPREGGKKTSHTNPYSTYGTPGGRWTRSHLGNWATWRPCVCCPCLKGECPREPPACVPSAAQARPRGEQKQPKGCVMSRERQQKYREVAPPTTSYWPPPPLEVREEAPPKGTSKNWVQVFRQIASYSKAVPAHCF